MLDIRKYGSHILKGVSHMKIQVLSALVLVPAAVLLAQENRGTFSGSVTDSSGSAIAKAKVVVTEMRTGAKATASTETSGAYNIPFLPLGEYEISAESPGFKKYVQQGITLSAGAGASPKQIFVDPNPGWHCHYPIWSTDGKWIYFVRGNLATLEMDLWRISPSGGQPERLTHHNANVASPAPINEHTVLYVSPAEDGSGPWLYALNVDRKTSRRISFGLEQYLSIAASANGHRMVATVANPSASLWSVPILDRPADEELVKRFPVPTVRALAPRFGGGSLFYLSSLGGGDGLWRYRDNQLLEIRRGTEGPLFDPAAVSSDGKRVAMAVRRQGETRLEVTNEDGTGAVPMSETLDVRGSGSWSRMDAGSRSAQRTRRVRGYSQFPAKAAHRSG